MKRTRGSLRRRREIANAASGFTRAAVVAYACVPADIDPAPIVAGLHEYASARDWTVLAEVIDRCPLTTPIDDRTGWPEVRDLIDSRRASGIVTAAPAMCGCHSHDQEHVADWLAERNAFSVFAFRPDATELDGIQ